MRGRARPCVPSTTVRFLAAPCWHCCSWPCWAWGAAPAGPWTASARRGPRGASARSVRRCVRTRLRIAVAPDHGASWWRVLAAPIPWSLHARSNPPHPRRSRPRARHAHAGRLHEGSLQRPVVLLRALRPPRRALLVGPFEVRVARACGAPDAGPRRAAPAPRVDGPRGGPCGCPRPSPWRPGDVVEGRYAVVDSPSELTTSSGAMIPGGQ